MFLMINHRHTAAGHRGRGGGKQGLALSLQRELEECVRQRDTQIRGYNDPQTFSLGKIIIILTFIGHEFLQLNLKSQT